MDLKALLGGRAGGLALRHGGYATAVTALVITAIVVVNLLVARMDLQQDITDRGLFSLSDPSTRVAREVEEDIELIALFEPGQEQQLVLESLNNYARLNDRISVVTEDAEENPGLVSEYTDGGRQPQNGAVIVAGENQFRVIEPQQLFSGGSRRGASRGASGGDIHLDVERRVTNALLYVTRGSVSRGVVMEGLGSPGLAETGIVEDLEAANFEFDRMPAVQLEDIDPEVDILAIAAAEQDIPENAVDLIDEYLQSGGGVLLLADAAAGDIPNIDELLERWGLDRRHGIIFEGDDSRRRTREFDLVPEMLSHPIVQPLREAETPAVFATTMGLRPKSTLPRDLSVEPLLRTSDQAWLRTDLTNADPSRRPGDEDGPFFLAAAVTDEQNSGRLVAVPSVRFLGRHPQLGEVNANRDLVLNAAGWLRGDEVSVNVPSRRLGRTPMTLSATEVYVLSAIALGVLPGSVLLAGVIIWLRRRHL